ncbi:MAG: hypothetical protein AAGK04_06240 [Planctomycetota bacterium]
MEHRVTQCICFDVSFETIWQRLCAGQTISDIHRELGCGGKCGLCVPYIKHMCKTGEIHPPVMWTQDFVSEGINPTPIDRLETLLEEEPSPPA